MKTDYTQAKDYTRGRSGKRIDRIIIHHWGVDGQTHDGVVNFFRRGSGTSAHYVVSGGRITQMVSENDTAWHAGNWDANTRSIGIECRPEATAADMATIGELIRQIWSRHGRLPLHLHSEYIATACPGRYSNRLGDLAALAAPAKPAPAKPALEVDGIWGGATSRAAARVFGTPADGVVSSQSAYWRKYIFLGSGWEWVGENQAVGSQLIYRLQRYWKVPAPDGLIGDNTLKKMGAFYGKPAGMEAIKEFQRRLNKDLAEGITRYE